jgi:hypothetical protein
MESALIMRPANEVGKGGMRMVSPAFLCKRGYWDKEAVSDELTDIKYKWSCLKIGKGVGKTRTLKLDFPFLLELSENNY